MAFPAALKNKTYGVFCYTADLEKATRTLAGIIRSQWVRVLLNRGGFAGIRGDIPSMGQVAWLVGHGLSTDSLVGSLQRGTFVEISEILDWLVGEGYAAVVDTCCQPNRRRLVAAEYPLDYYACPDDVDVYQIHEFKTLDLWWDTCKIALRSTGPEDDDGD